MSVRRIWVRSMSDNPEVACADNLAIIRVSNRPAISAARLSGARRRHQRDDCPAHSASLAPLRMVSVVPLVLLTFYLVEIDDRTSSSPCSISPHSVPERVDGIEAAAPIWIQRSRGRTRERHITTALVSRNRFRPAAWREKKLRRKQFVLVSQTETADRFDIQAISMPTKARSGCRPLRSSTRDQEHRMIIPANAHVRRIAISLPLSFTSISGPRRY